MTREIDQAELEHRWQQATGFFKKEGVQADEVVRWFRGIKWNIDYRQRNGLQSVSLWENERDGFLGRRVDFIRDSGEAGGGIFRMRCGYDDQGSFYFENTEGDFDRETDGVRGIAIAPDNSMVVIVADNKIPTLSRIGHFRFRRDGNISYTEDTEIKAPKPGEIPGL